MRSLSGCLWRHKRQVFFNVSDNGNVGIGNSDPQHALDVSGAMYSRLVAVDDASSTTVDWNDGNVQSIVLDTSNTNFSFANGQAGGEYTLVLNQDVTGGRTVDWPMNVSWPGGFTPSLSTEGSTTDMAKFVYDGSRYLGYMFNDFRSTPRLITFSQQNVTNAGSDTSSITVEMTNTGSDIADVIYVVGAGNNTDTLIGCTDDGEAATQLEESVAISDRYDYALAYVGATSGTRDIVCTASGAGIARVYVLSYTNVGSVYSHAKNNGGSASSWSINSSHSNYGLTTAYFHENGTNTLSAGSGYTIRNNSFSSRVTGDSSTTLTPAGTHTMNVSSNNSDTWQALTVSLAPVI